MTKSDIGGIIAHGTGSRVHRLPCYTKVSFIKEWGCLMSNLTISVDENLIKQARVRAIQQGTSLSAKVRDFLQVYVNEADKTFAKQRADATISLMAAIDVATAQTSPNLKPPLSTASGSKQKRQTLREELYEGDFRARDRLQAQGRSKNRANP